MNTLLILIVLALILGGGFVLRLIGLAIGVVLTIVGVAVVLVWWWFRRAGLSVAGRQARILLQAITVQGSS